MATRAAARSQAAVPTLLKTAGRLRSGPAMISDASGWTLLQISKVYLRKKFAP